MRAVASRGRVSPIEDSPWGRIRTNRKTSHAAPFDGASDFGLSEANGPSLSLRSYHWPPMSSSLEGRDSFASLTGNSRQSTSYRSIGRRGSALLQRRSRRFAGFSLGPAFMPGPGANNPISAPFDGAFSLGLSHRQHCATARFSQAVAADQLAGPTPVAVQANQIAQRDHRQQDGNGAQGDPGAGTRIWSIGCGRSERLLLPGRRGERTTGGAGRRLGPAGERRNDDLP